MSTAHHPLRADEPTRPAHLERVDLAARIAETTEGLAVSAAAADMAVLAHLLRVAMREAEETCEQEIARAYEITRVRMLLQE